MINPGKIPRIPGDMDALAWHANGLRTAGQGFADTGAQVHSTWQGLAPVYEAPEAEQLFSVTTPVSQVSDRLGGDIEEVAGALSRYADEVRPIQQRLEQLRAQAQQLVSEINSYDQQGHTETQYVPSGSPHAPIAATQAPSTDWHDDEELVERNNQLNAQVAAAVADWMAAQRRCANRITSMYGGTHYTADNADGHQTAGEFGYSKDQLAAAAAHGKLPWGSNEEATPDMGDMFADFGHGVLDVAGLVPVIGEPADGANAAWYAAEGDYVNAGLSAAGMIPFAGWAATGSKLVGKGVKAAKGADEATKVSRMYRRPSGFRKGVRDQVWDDAVKQSPGGKVRDPTSNEVISKDESWHMGHRPGYEFRKHQESAAERGIDRKKFLDEHNDPNHYRPEKPEHNSGHRGEDHTDSYFGP